MVGAISDDGRSGVRSFYRNNSDLVACLEGHGFVESGQTWTQGLVCGVAYYQHRRHFGYPLYLRFLKEIFNADSISISSSSRSSNLTSDSKIFQKLFFEFKKFTPFY